MKRYAKHFIWILLVLLLVSTCFTASAKTVHEGNRGIKLIWGKAQNEILNPGWYWTFIGEDIVEMSVQWQRYEITASAFSRDIQQVDVLLSISYQLQSDSVLNTYKTIGVNYADQIMLPRSIDAIKAVFAKYSAEELIINRQTISSEIFNLIHSQMEGYGVNVKEVALENIDFTDSFEAAVEQKQVATQTKLKTQIEQDQQTIIATAEADRAKISATAEAEQKIIRAKADAEAIRIAADAESYRLEQESKNITEMTIKKETVEKWNGQLPTITGSGTPIVDLTNIDPLN